MKKFIFSFIVIFVLVIGGIFAWKYIIVPKDHVVVNLEQEYEEYLNLVYGDETEKSFEFSLAEYVDVEISGLPTRYSETVTCKITFPDMYTFWKENGSEFADMDDEELKEHILDSCKKIDTKTIKLTFDAVYENGYLLLDSDCFEYHDAMCCGLYTVLTEEYCTAISELLEEK